MSSLTGVRALRRVAGPAVVAAVLMLWGAAVAGASSAHRPSGGRPSATAGAPASHRAAVYPMRAVWPTPQKIVNRGGGVVLGTKVVVVAPTTGGQVAVNALMKVLVADGVTHIQRVGPTASSPAGVPRIIVGTEADNAALAPALQALNQAGPAALAAQGYVLGAGTVDHAATVAVAGVDAQGAFNGVQTLRQLLFAPHGRPLGLPAVGVRDWPATAQRGVIEGFYGAPWSTADRISDYAFEGELKGNTYVYSPKDDSYLRADWRQPYPAAQLAVIKHLISAARTNGQTFVYAISPGLSICYSDPSDLAALEAKLAQLWSVGAREFDIPFDDIDEGAWNCSGDQTMFGDPGGADAAAAQAYVLNAVVKDFIDTHSGAAPLITVPTEYTDSSPTPYTEKLSSALDPSVLVQWTGPAVIPATITTAQTKQAKALWGHDILLWDNYPVNDYVTDRLLLGPYEGRAPGMAAQLAGVTANPMIEEEPSKIALFTIADYLWNPQAYAKDPTAAWQAGIKMIGGRVWKALEVFADNNYSSDLDPVESPTLAPLISAFENAAQSGGSLTLAASALDAYFAQMRAAPAQLNAGLDNPDFLAQTKPWLTKLGLYGHAGEVAVTALVDQRAGDARGARHALAKLQRLTAQLAQIPQQVAPGVMDPFLAKVQSLITSSPDASLSVQSATTPLAGADTTVTETVTNSSGSAISGVHLALAVPTGWQSVPTGAPAATTLAPGASTQRSWTVTVPGSATPGSYGVVGSAGYQLDGAPGAAVGLGHVLVPYASLAGAVDNVGITDDSDVSPADLAGGLDGDGSSLSAQDLAGLGIAPGKAFTTAGGLTFTWPGEAAGTPDNVLADGQTISVGAGGSRLALLTTATYGPASGTGTINYGDGTTQSFTIDDPDWYAAPPPGSSVAVTTDYHNLSGTGRVTRSAYLYANSVALQSGKTVASVTLPTVGAGTTGGTTALHVFAISVQ